MYGYQEDVASSGSNSTRKFGLNTRVKMTEFKWIPNAGKGGAEAEALEIKFNVDGGEYSYRQFPVTKAFGKDNQEITDPNSEEMKAEFERFNQVIVHLVSCFVPHETIRTAMANPIADFKQYCEILTSILPANFGARAARRPSRSSPDVVTKVSVNFASV